MYAFGSTIDWRTKSGSAFPAVCAYGVSLASLGPTVVDEPAAVSVWKAPKLLFLKTAPPATVVFGEVTACACAFAYLSNAAGVITIASVRMTAWPSPQSSVQMTSNVPRRFGVMCSRVVRPGTVSCFCENSETQKEWITSFDVKTSSTERPRGRRSVPLVRLCDSGYVKLQANCWAVTLTRK